MLVVTTNISCLLNHLLTGLSAFHLGLPKVPPLHSRQADPVSLLKSRVHFEKNSVSYIMRLLYLNTAFQSERKLTSSRWPTGWLLGTTVFSLTVLQPRESLLPLLAFALVIPLVCNDFPQLNLCIKGQTLLVQRELPPPTPNLCYPALFLFISYSTCTLYYILLLWH